MEPTFSEGDHVLTFNWRIPKAGDVIVFKDDNRYLIKRMEKIIGVKILATGDNKKRLSSKIYTVLPNKVIGRVILKY